jgi:hypothetical protein
MLAELFMLRLEAIARANNEVASVSNSLFVPVALPPSTPSRDNKK